MINTLKKAFDLYFSKLENTGEVSAKDTNILLVMGFLRKYVNSSAVAITQKELNMLERMFGCVVANSCFIDDLPHYMINTPTSGNIITQNGISMVSNQGVNLATQTGNEVRRFSDFAYQQSFGPEDYIAGYDSTTNENIRVGADSITINWHYF